MINFNTLKAKALHAFSMAGAADIIGRAIALDATPRHRYAVIGRRRDHTGRVLVRVFDLRWRKPHEDRARSGKPWRHNDTTSLARRTRRAAAVRVTP